MTHDLTFVAPERRDEVRRRINAIERFLTKPGRRMAEECAAELGLGHAQFYNLVRAWRKSGNVDTLMGRNRSRKMQPRIDKRVIDLIDEVIAAAPRAPARQIISAVNEGAAGRGVLLPDPSTVSRYVRRRRPSLLDTEGLKGFDLIVDHTVIDIPVDFGSIGVRRPLATMVIDVAAEAIVGLALSPRTPNPTPTATALLDAFRFSSRIERAPASQPRIGIVARSENEGGAAIETLRRAGLSADYLKTHAHGGGMMIEALLGREHAGLRLKQRLVWNTGNRRLASPRPGTSAMAPAEADALVRGRLLVGRSTTMLAELDDVAQGIVSQASKGGNHSV